MYTGCIQQVHQHYALKEHLSSITGKLAKGNKPEAFIHLNKVLKIKASDHVQIFHILPNSWHSSLAICPT